MSELVLAADLGGTNLRLGIVDDRGAVIHLAKESTPDDASPGQILPLIRKLADQCLSSMDGGEIAAVAFAVPAPVPKDFGGVLTKLPNLPELVGWNLKDALKDMFRLPITAENDATAAAIGERWIGASEGVDNSICVTLGTGIGGGIILNGAPVRGIDGIGGEIGHICVEPDGLPCGCGSHGCIEQYASATAIVRMAKEAGIEADSSATVYEKFIAGDECAAMVFASMGRHLGIMLAGLANTLNPEMIVICGGVTAGWDAFAGSLQTEMNVRAYPQAASRARIRRGKLGDMAGMTGVAHSAFASHGLLQGRL